MEVGHAVMMMKDKEPNVSNLREIRQRRGGNIERQGEERRLNSGSMLTDIWRFYICHSDVEGTSPTIARSITRAEIGRSLSHGIEATICARSCKGKIENIDTVISACSKWKSHIGATLTPFTAVSNIGRTSYKFINH